VSEKDCAREREGEREIVRGPAEELGQRRESNSCGAQERERARAREGGRERERDRERERER